MDGKLHLKVLRTCFLTVQGQVLGQSRPLRQDPVEVSNSKSSMNCCLTILQAGGNGQMAVAGTFWALCGNGQDMNTGKSEPVSYKGLDQGVGGKI